jgi:2-keto-3-deoxy-L-rhamnonate aldolase RhmA
VTVNASDQVWADPALPTERSYLNAVATGYDAGVAQAPLLRDPEQARQEINRARPGPDGSRGTCSTVAVIQRHGSESNTAHARGS